jgi:general secretion pathway protein G
LRLSFSTQPSPGFTLLELLVVVAIIGTLTSIAIPVYSNQILKARIAKAIFDIRTIDRSIQLYKLDRNTLPANLTDVGMQNLLDPWGNPYRYANHAHLPPGHRRKYRFIVPLNTDYDLYSMGPNKITNWPLTSPPGRDDIVRADDGRFVGPGYDF